MSDANDAKTNKPPKDPYNVEKFEEFIKAIGEANIENWSIMAEALGVSRSTILRWKQHPVARQALKAGIARAVAGMEKVGDKDWKMHREKAKMLGVKDKQTIEHEAGENIGDLLDQLQTDYGKLGQEARKQMVADEPPVQNKG